MKKKTRMMHVSEDFHHLFKSKAADEGKSIIDYSEEIAKKAKTDNIAMPGDTCKPKRVKIWDWKW